MLFTEDYYRRVIAENGYDPIDFQPIDFSLLGLDAAVLQKKWLCHHYGNIFAHGVNLGRPNIVTTGFGLSGIPHAGTIAQMLGAILLQQSGLRVQVVLGDLDAYNSRNQSLNAVTERAELYRAFLVNLGFDESKGILRTQISRPDVLLTSYIVSHYVRDEDLQRTEEDLSEFYKNHGIYPGITFPVKQAILLMASDFLHLRNECEFVLVMLGLDEHRYVQLARTIADRMGLLVSVCGLYSRMNKGFSGYPKMSKSFPGSGIMVDMSPEKIRDLLLNSEGGFSYPMESPVYQMMCSTSFYTAAELDAMYETCQRGGMEWKKAKDRYADMLISICEKWPGR